MSAERAREQANTRAFLNDSQRRVVEEVLNSSDRIHGLQGLAGTGKTTTLQTIRDGAEASGYVVEGFAPTSKAAGQLREAGIDATTLQSFFARGQNHPSSDLASRHLYMLDESSLASTKQMRSFLGKLNPDDRVLVIGDIRQHQGVDAGRPFQQMQEAGMQTSHLDRIMRQKDPELLKAVEHLSKHETEAGVGMLKQQGRITQIADPEQRISAIAKTYAAHPDNTIIVSPDNASRRALNEVVRRELKSVGLLEREDRSIRVLTPRSDMTGADRAWAARYQPGDVLHYIRGSKDRGIEAGSYAQVVATVPKENLVTVRRSDGELATYDPARLRGISAYREIERDFAIGDRVQLRAPNHDLKVANRDLGKLTHFDSDGRITLRMDSGKDVSFDPREMRHFDHGYAVTSHSSQGLTSERVLVNMDTNVHPELINERFAYVSVSRASHDAQIFTNDATTLAESLSRDVSKTSAIDFGKAQKIIPNLAEIQSPVKTNIRSSGIELSL
jgi:ATP-dependent exoDNAse (exonuclease V) alpha subunit